MKYDKTLMLSLLLIIISLLVNYLLYNEVNKNNEEMVTIKKQFNEIEEEYNLLKMKYDNNTKYVAELIDSYDNLRDNYNALENMLLENKSLENNYEIPYGFMAGEVLQKGDLSTYNESDLLYVSNRYKIIITNYYEKNKSAIELLKTYNPDIIILMYYNVHSINSNLDTHYDLAQKNDWILIDSNGEEIYEQNWDFNKCLDIGNEQYRDWISNLLSDRVNSLEFDGILGDNTNSLLDTRYGVSGAAINPRTNEEYNNTDYRNDMILLVEKIMEKNPGKIFVGNGVGHLQGATSLGYFNYKDFVEPLIGAQNGVMIEGFIRWNQEDWRDEESWLLDIETLRQISNKGLYTLAWIKSYGVLPSNASWEQVSEYGITSYLLGVEGKNSFFSVSGYDYDLFSQSHYTWKDVGLPVKPYYSLNETNIYLRDYTGSLIVVNPSDSPYEINLNDIFFTLQGEPISELLIKSHSGIILMRE